MESQKFRIWNFQTCVVITKELVSFFDVVSDVAMTTTETDLVSVTLFP